MKFVCSISSEDSGATRANENAAIAICEALKASGTITPHAFIVGVLLHGIIEEVLAPDEQDKARELINLIGIPMNMRELDELTK